MKTFTIIHLRGTQAEMGYQHGRMVREAAASTEIEAQALECYPNIAQRLLADANVHGLIPGMVHGLVKRVVNGAARGLEFSRPSAYLARSRAFLRGLELPAHLSRQFMLMDVFQNAVGVAGRLRIGPLARAAAQVAVPACSSVAAWEEASADETLLHGRNLDFPAIGVWDAHPSVVFCDPNEGLRYGYVSTMGVDLPGPTSFNEAGLTVSAHTRFHRDVAFRGAAIVDLCHDIVRRAESLSDAVRIARERRVASTWGIMISSAAERSAIVIETTSQGAEVVTPPVGRSYLTCANANRHPRLIADQVSPMPAFIHHSDTREQRLVEVMEATRRTGGATVNDVQRLLGDHEGLAHPGEERAGGGVIAQAIAVLSAVSEPERRQIHVSTGDAPTGWGPYIAIPWEWESPVGAVERSCDSRADDSDPDHPLKQGRRFRSGPAGEAFELWVEASALDLQEHDSRRTAALIARAVTLDPESPTYRFVAGVLALRHGEFDAALVHFEAGLVREHGPFRRGQFLLWGSRAAGLVARFDRARELRDELLRLQGANLEELKSLARDDARKPYSKRQASKLLYNLAVVDAL